MSKTFPVDVLRLILFHLQCKDLVRLSKVDKYFRNLVSESWPFLFEKHWPQYVSVIKPYIYRLCGKKFFDFEKFNFTNSITNTSRLSCPVCGEYLNQRLSESSLERVCLLCPFKAQCGPYIIQENDCCDLKRDSAVVVIGACYECGSVRCEDCFHSCRSSECACDGNHSDYFVV